MKKTINLLLIISAIFILDSCSKKNDDEGSRKVEYRVTVVKADIIRIVYTDAEGNQKSLGSQPGLVWTSGELIISNSIKPLKITAEADDLFGVSSLKVEIYINGELKAENIDSIDDNYIFEAEASMN